MIRAHSHRFGSGLAANAEVPVDVPVIVPEQAKAYVGKEVVVRGYVFDVGVSDNDDSLLLNFGGVYPGHFFNAVILSAHLASFPDARSWAHKVIKVRGQVQPYNGRGKPEIVLERPEQVTVELETTATLAGLPEGVQGAGEVDAVAGPGGGVTREAVSSPATGLDSPPRPIKQARPQYPQEAYVKKIDGTVLVEALIDTSGRVVRARILHSVPLLDSAALEAAYRWVFQPAIKNGKRVPTIIHMPVAFRIYDNDSPEGVEQREADHTPPNQEMTRAWQRDRGAP